MLIRAVATGQTQLLGEGGIRPEELAGGTVTVSNIGSICRVNGTVALLEIIPPQVLAQGVASMQEKPGVFVSGSGNKEIGIRRFLAMCLAFDHRALDFGDMVPFIDV